MKQFYKELGDLKQELQDLNLDKLVRVENNLDLEGSISEVISQLNELKDKEGDIDITYNYMSECIYITYEKENMYSKECRRKQLIKEISLYGDVLIGLLSGVIICDHKGRVVNIQRLVK